MKFRYFLLLDKRTRDRSGRIFATSSMKGFRFNFPSFTPHQEQIIPADFPTNCIWSTFHSHPPRVNFSNSCVDSIHTSICPYSSDPLNESRCFLFSEKAFEVGRVVSVADGRYPINECVAPICLPPATFRSALCYHAACKYFPLNHLSRSFP